MKKSVRKNIISEINSAKNEINDIINYPPDYDPVQIQFLYNYIESLEGLLMKDPTFIQELKYLDESDLSLKEFVFIITKMFKKRIWE